MAVKQERTSWRDLGLSQRHRTWGWDCPAVDIDFLLLEYNKGKAIALIEYKHEQAKELSPSHPSYKALKDLADKAGVFLFGCRYANDYSWFRIIPGNGKAKCILPEIRQLSEDEYISWLYSLRGLKTRRKLVE